MNCSRCGSTEFLQKIRVGSNGRQGYICKSCNAARAREYRKTEKGKAAIKKAGHNYYLKNKEKNRAWYVANKINSENEPCSICGVSPSIKHHPDYNKPEIFIRLCSYHHKQEHRKVIS